MTTKQDAIDYLSTVWAEEIELSRVPDRFKELIALIQTNTKKVKASSNLYSKRQVHGRALRELYDTSNKRPVINDCTRCGGTGHIRAYSHIKGGLCFHCEGME